MVSAPIPLAGILSRPLSVVSKVGAFYVPTLLKNDIRDLRLL
jgi:hypothetical protein